jgi:hypothetical protein
MQKINISQPLHWMGDVAHKNKRLALIKEIHEDYSSVPDDEKTEEDLNCY